MNPFYCFIVTFSFYQAFIDNDDSEMSYKTLKVAINRACNGLRELGLREDDVFALHLPNTPHFVCVPPSTLYCTGPIRFSRVARVAKDAVVAGQVRLGHVFFVVLRCRTAFHAIANSGGIVTTSNPTYGPRELAHQLRDTGARFVLTLPMFKETVNAACEEAGCVEKAFYLGEERTFLQCEDDTPFTPPTMNPREKVLVMPFSSGTSGLPKGVELTHRNVVANIHQLTADSEFNVSIFRDDVVMGLLPLFHIYGMTVIVSTSLRVGATTVLMPKFDPENFLTKVQKHKVTFAPIVPPVLLFLAKHPVVDRFDMSSLRVLISGAAPLDAELTEVASKRLHAPVVQVRFPISAISLFGGCLLSLLVAPIDCCVWVSFVYIYSYVSLVQGYGMTESSPATLISTPERNRPGSCGVLLPNTEALIVDTETQRPLGPGSENRGELWVRGPQVMKGYHNNPEATAETLDSDGWLHTGDIAYCDEDGFFFVVDRLKELIKVKGYQVAPAELEGLLLEMPEVADAAVIGIPSEREGEVPRAYVVRAKDSTITEEEVVSRMAEKTAAFKRLAGGVEFVDAIPKSASGKILRRVLRDKFEGKE